MAKSLMKAQDLDKEDQLWVKILEFIATIFRFDSTSFDIKYLMLRHRSGGGEQNVVGSLCER